MRVLYAVEESDLHDYSEPNLFIATKSFLQHSVKTHLHCSRYLQSFSAQTGCIYITKLCIIVPIYTVILIASK